MIIAVDFDGTVVDHRFPRMGLDLPHAVRVLNRIISEGHDLILFTMRSGVKLKEAEQWYGRHGIPLYSVNTHPNQASWTSSPKAHADIYIDDRGLGVPLMKEYWMESPGVDWLLVEKLLEEAGILEKSTDKKDT